MIGQPLRAYGADDVAPFGLMSKKLRFHVIANTDVLSVSVLADGCAVSIVFFAVCPRRRIGEQCLQCSLSEFC